MNPARSSCVARMVCLCALILDAGAASGSETPRIGGPGGDRTVRMECGPGTYLTGFSARGGVHFPGDFNVLRRLRFSCRNFTVTGSPDGATPDGVEPRYGIGQETTASVRCPDGEALHKIVVYAGLYVDSIRFAYCSDDNRVFPLEVRVGGSGGQQASLSCPSGERLYRVDARAGDAIDSLRGYCRRFPPAPVDPNAPVFDAAPAQGAIVTLPAMTGGEIPLRAHGATGPVTLSLQVLSPYASRFDLIVPRVAAGTITTALPATQLASATSATAVSRILRLTGPVAVNPQSGSPTVPVAITVRDGAGRTTTRSFTVYLK